MIIVDVETTGLNWDKHSLLSIGAIDFSDSGRQFYEECRMWDGASVEDEALAVNGFTREQIVDQRKQSEAELISTFLGWIYASAEYTVAGQNVYVDTEFIRAAAQRAGKDAKIPHRIIDLHSICYAHMVQRGIEPPVKGGKTALNSRAISEYVGIPPEPKPHYALNGATWEAEAFQRLLYDQALFDEFQEYSVPWEEKQDGV